MSDPVPTESRIFAARYLRELGALERRHAGLISPGSQSWPEAMTAIGARLKRAGSPVRLAKIVGSVEQALIGKRAAARDDAVKSFYLIATKVRSRSASLSFASFSVSDHPLGIDEGGRQGVAICLHILDCDRRGNAHLLPAHPMSYISHHALGRAHQRGLDLTTLDAVAMLGVAGVAGYLMAPCEKHLDGELALTFSNDLVLVGVLRRCRRLQTDGVASPLLFYDVRTTLQASDRGCEERRERGRIATNAVMRWVRQDFSAVEDLVGMIPVHRSDGRDHVSRMLALEPA